MTDHNIRARANPRNRFNNCSRARMRLRQLERIIEDQHGSVPETDDADLYLTPVANCFHVVAAGRDRCVSVDKIVDLLLVWCERWAPHIGIAQATEIVWDACDGYPKLIADDVLGGSIRLSYADRLRLRITTIGSFDADAGSRKKLAKARRRERGRLSAAAKRKAGGATPRANSLSQTKPWESEGVSRRTWERRQKKAAATPPAVVANSSPHNAVVVANSSPHHSFLYEATKLRHDAKPAPSSPIGHLARAGARARSLLQEGAR